MIFCYFAVLKQCLDPLNGMCDLLSDAGGAAGVMARVEEGTTGNLVLERYVGLQMKKTDFYKRRGVLSPLSSSSLHLFSSCTSADVRVSTREVSSRSFCPFQ